MGVTKKKERDNTAFALPGDALASLLARAAAMACTAVLPASLLLSGCGGAFGCKSGNCSISAGGEEDGGFSKAAVVLYRESRNAAPWQAPAYGGGVFVSRTVNGEKRIFLVTANHVMDCMRSGADFGAVQTGIRKKGEDGTILRATMPENGVRWFAGDAYRDIVAADVTDSLYGLDALGADLLPVDLDKVRKNAPGEKCVCIAAAGKDSYFANPGMTLWTSPFATKKGKIVSTGVDRAHVFTDGAVSGRVMQHRVDVATVECRAGDSGSPVFASGGFCGIAIGAGGGAANISPAEAVAAYIDAAYGVNLSKEPLADDALREVDATTVRGGGNETVKIFETWRPGIRRVVFEAGGTCLASNAMSAAIGVRYSTDEGICDEDTGLRIFWDNTDPECERSVPGYKKMSIVFDLDESGRTLARRMGPDPATVDFGGEEKAAGDIDFDRSWNFLKIETKGEGFGDAYARVIRYAAKE